MYKISLAILIGLFAFSAEAQESVRCYSTEHELELQEKYSHRSDRHEFEEWMSKELKAGQMKSDRGVVTLPIVFHVMHSGTPVGSGLNISADLINAQLQQLNDDFRRTPGTAGFNTNPVGADLEIEFCMAAVDPEGNILAEPGIDRINGPGIGLQSPGYSINYLDNTVKPATIWDPDQYINIWVSPINLFFFNVLGYAQFPSLSGLPGLNADEGLALTDGVVVSTETVGSIDFPNPNGAAVGGGRTLTHELGHFFGLRHIWGDGGCNADDFCADTPFSNGSNSGCQIGSVSCSSVDMVENYMDYSNDACMNIFTQDQKARVDAVLLNSPRRVELLSGTACSTDAPLCQNPYPAVEEISAVIVANGVQLSWTSVEGSIGCRIRAGLASVGFQTTVTVFESEASEFFVPASAILPGSEYQWQVQCGCSVNPLVVGPWSTTGFFSFGSAIALQRSSSFSADSKVKVYPNPVQDILTIESDDLTEYTIFDLKGVAIKRERLLGADRSLVRVDVSSLTPGFYLISTTSNNGGVNRATFVVN